MDSFTLITVLVTLCAGISYINLRFLKLPGTIGIMVAAILISVIILVTGKSSSLVSRVIIKLTGQIDFTKALLDIMLGFLLFASALHFDYGRLKIYKGPIMVLSTVGVILSTLVFGALLYGAGQLLHIDIPLIWCLLFGALISPTDPVAVMSVLNKSKIPPSLRTIIGGESLLNDGVGIILFVTLGEIAVQHGDAVSVPHILELFVEEVFGGILLGTGLAAVAYFTMKKIQEFETILFVSLSMVMCISLFGSLLHVSVPLAAVSAGLLLGNTSLGPRQSRALQDYFHQFWKLVDDLLNTILFVMIGLQIVVMPFITNYWLVGLLSVIFVLVARSVSILLPTIFMRRTLNVDYRSGGILVWAGLRGGISVALALSLPASPYKELILSASYIIVIFSVIIQGLTLGKVVNSLSKE
ncbi:MAG: sodium:proton antiporter [Sphingobacteriales bacterium]|nr:sodium:proton antiporter [Sphingobacteriales bacterium]OJY87573.1 MAG: sodium:proton antiporter [Sphingobacteriales bacterium 44-15]